MDKKNIIFLVFCLVVAAQLYVPAHMIIGREDVLNAGKAFKFETEPIDPSDPFRGKYLTLRYKATTAPTNEQNKWDYNAPVYVWISNDEKGFAKIDSVAQEKPAGNLDFIRAKVSYVYDGDSVTIEYPFDRFYMEESKAEGAELIYQNSLLDSTQVAYGLVYVKDGEAVLKDVIINNTPIKDLVKNSDEYNHR